MSCQRSPTAGWPLSEGTDERSGSEFDDEADGHGEVKGDVLPAIDMRRSAGTVTAKSATTNRPNGF